MRHHRTMAGIAAGLMLVGCVDRDEPFAPSPTTAVMQDERDPYGFRQLVEVMSSETPPSDLRINDDLRVRFVGTGNLVSGSPPTLPEEGFRARDGRNEPRNLDHSFGAVQFRVFNGVTRNEFEISVSPQMLKEIHALRSAAGLTSATEGVDNPAVHERGIRPGPENLSAHPQDPGYPILRGWSNGQDTRVIFPSTTSWPWRTISQFTYGFDDSRCSGTLIGPRHVITAAHCLVAQGTNNWNTVTVTPGRDGPDEAPFGTSTVSVNPAPGTEVWYFTPSAWRDPNTANPRQWDWGMLVIPNRLGDLTGWMGYVARTFGDLADESNYNRGYPSCSQSFAERPAGCQTGRLYGDVNLCNLGGVAYPGTGGWNRLISASCDLSRGHSGSPIYHYFFDPASNKYVPVVSMMVVSHTCLTCTPADNFPNWSRRITPVDLQVISWLRQAFP